MSGVGSATDVHCDWPPPWLPGEVVTVAEALIVNFPTCFRPDLMLSKIDPDASRVWWQWGRRPTRVVCSVTNPGERFWIWVNTSQGLDDDDDDLSVDDVDIISVQLKPLRRAQSRYAEKAERDLTRAIQNAQRMVASGF